MAETRYTSDHEWVRLDGDVATVGITDHAQQALGDLVHIELPEVGGTVAQGDPCAVVESVKAASDVYAPLGGEITEINQAIIDDPSLVNRDPAGAGWFFKLAVATPAGFESLLDDAAYKALLETL